MNDHATRKSNEHDPISRYSEYLGILKRNPGVIPEQKIDSVLRELNELALPGHYTGTLKGIRTFGAHIPRHRPTVQDARVEYEVLSKSGRREFMPIDLFVVNYRILSTDMR